MSRQKNLAKNTAILTFGKICTQCISFLLLPLYTAILSRDEYGAFDLMITYATLLLPLVNWQFDQGLFRFMLDCRRDKEKVSGLFSTTFIVNTLQSAAYSLFIFVICVFADIPHGLFIWIYVVIQVYVALFLQFARGLGKNRIYAVGSFISASATVILNVITLTVFHMGLKGLYVATIAAQIFTLIYLCIAEKFWIYFNLKLVKKSIFNSMKKYSLPLIPNNLAWWIVNVSDRTIVSHILGISVNGIYTVANKFSNVFINFYNIFNLSWTETVSLHFNDPDRDSFLSETMTTLYKLFSCACFGIVACMPFVFPIMVNEKYSEAYPQIIILMYAMLLRVLVGLYSCVYVATKESRKIAFTSVASAVINVTINLLLISKIGLYAASLSTLIAFGSMAFIRYIEINKTIHMRISSTVLISSVILGAILSVTYYMNQTSINIIMFIVVCVYSLYMNWSFAVSAIQMARDFAKKILSERRTS